MSHLFAYVDLSSGSLMVQLVIASIVAVPFVLRSQISRAVAAMRAWLAHQRMDVHDGARRD